MTDPAPALALKFGAYETKLQVKYVIGECKFAGGRNLFSISAQFWSTISCLIELILAPDDSLFHSLPFRHQKLAFLSIFDQGISQRCYRVITFPFNFADGRARFLLFGSI